MSQRWAIVIGDWSALVQGRVVVGRAPDCDVTLDDGSASRRHAALLISGGKLWVEDLGSRNGVLVNGKPIKKSTALAHDDEVMIGTTVITVTTREESTMPAPADVRRGDPPGKTGARNVAEDVEESTVGGYASVHHHLLRACESALARRDVRVAASSLGYVVSMILADAKRGQHPPQDVMDEVGRLSVRVATMTRDSIWLDRLEELRKLKPR